MPYCCAAKSNRKDAGARMRTVDCVLPIVVGLEAKCMVGIRERGSQTLLCSLWAKHLYCAKQ
jgi:hypothetical protein